MRVKIISDSTCDLSADLIQKYDIVPSNILDSYSCSVYTPKGIITVRKDGNNLTVTAVSGGTLVLPDGREMPLQEGEHTYCMT